MEVTQEKFTLSRLLLRIPGYAFILTLFIVLAGVAIAVANGLPDASKPKPGPQDSMSYPAPIKDVLHGCGDIYLFNTPPKRNYGVIPSDLSGYDVPLVPTRIQAYGYMSAQPWQKNQQRFYAANSKGIPDNVQLMRAMWQGYYVVWYDKDNASTVQVKYLKRLTQTTPNLIVLPWMETNRMPMGRSYSMATWNISQSCESIEDKTVIEFLKLSDPKKRDKAHPPVAPLTDQKKLFPIYRQPSAKHGETYPNFKKDDY